MEYIGHFITGLVFLSANFALGWVGGAYYRKLKNRSSSSGIDIGSIGGKNNPLGIPIISGVGLIFLIPGLAGWPVVLYGYYGGWSEAPRSLLLGLPTILVPLGLIVVGTLFYIGFHKIKSGE